MSKGSADSEITRVLQRLDRGERDAYSELVPLVYDELRRRAARRLGAARGNTLQPTALVHEAFVRLMPAPAEGAAGGCAAASAWQGRRHFYNAAAEVMRQIVLNHARDKAALKRGGGRRRVELEGVEAVAAGDHGREEWDWEALDRALAELKAMDDRRHQVVMLRYFAGLTDAQVAATLGLSEKTVERDWAAAKAFLRARVREPDCG